MYVCIYACMYVGMYACMYWFIWQTKRQFLLCVSFECKLKVVLVLFLNGLDAKLGKQWLVKCPF
jgi:hypothetical protein